MRLHVLEHAIVMALGFLLGALLAMCITPGDVLLIVLTGVVLGVFARGFFDQAFGGEWVWPFHGLHRHGRGGSKPTASHR